MEPGTESPPVSYAPAYRPALGATAIDTATPGAGSPQSPIWPLIVGNNGAYLAVRSSPAQGACGVGSYPCKHPGVDVNGRAGTPVKAPETGVIVAAADGSAAPWRGYGPWLVVIRGDASGKFHLLAHLDPNARAMAPIGLRVSAGTVIGKVSSANHTHWELRKQLTPGSGGTNFTNNLDPIAWLRASGMGIGQVLLGGGAAFLLYLIWRR